ncbi:MAG: CYTH domain-containing protein [Bacteroidales bacterium]|nr:CYTH domain-containing protein [Bacteroidales bacterium]
MTEIERKYLVKGDFREYAGKSVRIIQGYIFNHDGKNLRIRIADKKAFLTIKAKTGESLVTRFEWEIEIDLNEAKELMNLCGEMVVEKERYIVTYQGQEFEVDVFHGRNEGLVIAELELESEDQKIVKPLWLGPEVSEDPRYTNSQLATHPFSLWEKRH